MKRCVLIGLALQLVLNLRANNIQWDGEAGDGLWTSVKNWHGDQLPTATDDVILDNKFVPEDYLVHLPSGNSSVQVHTLRVAPFGSLKITFLLPATNTSSSAFIASGSDNAIVIEAGGIIINASGAASGTPLAVTPAGYFRINNGGRYIHRTERGHTTNLANRLSSVAGTENGVFEFDVPASSFIVSFTGRTYGSLVFSSHTKDGPVSYNGNGVAPLTIRGDLLIDEGCTVSSGMSGDININGDLIVARNGIFNLQNTTPNNIIRLQGDVTINGMIVKTGLGIPTILLAGKDTQRLSLYSRIHHDVYLKIDNEKGIKLLRRLITGSRVDFLKGKIFSSDDSPLVLTDTASSSGAGEISFVEGPVWWSNWITDSCRFPVGQGAIYTPVKIFDKSFSLTDTLKVSYHRVNPQSGFGTDYDNDINHISFVEYWLIKGVRNGTIQLPVLRTSFITNMPATDAVRFNDVRRSWEKLTKGDMEISTAQPPYQTGWIKTGMLEGDGVYSFGTDQSVIENPLPISLLSFHGQRKEKSVMFDAMLGSICDSVNRVFLQGSRDGISFIPLRSTIRQSDCKLYIVVHGDTQGYYRLIIEKADGKRCVSQVIKITWEIKDNELILYPTIAGTTLTMEMESEKDKMVMLEFISMNGCIIERKALLVRKNYNRLVLDVNNLGVGWYVVQVSENGKLIGTRKLRIMR